MHCTPEEFEATGVVNINYRKLPIPSAIYDATFTFRYAFAWNAASYTSVGYANSFSLHITDMNNNPFTPNDVRVVFITA